MKALVLVLNLFICITAWSKDLTLADWQRATVKVYSHPGGYSPWPKFYGSGILISNGGRFWVITSEHVLYRGEDASHSVGYDIETPAGLKRANLIVDDYFMGLALLEVQYVNLGQFAIASEDLLPTEGFSSLTALGFPAKSSDLQTLTGGQIVTSDSRRGLIPGVSRFIEAYQLPVEYGMSGGNLIAESNSSYSYAGMISHQCLKRQTGEPTGTFNLSAKDACASTDLLIAIPAAEVLDWFHHTLQGKNELVWRHLWNADDRVETLRFGALLFQVKNQSVSEAWKIGGGDPSGVGGADGSVGGGVRKTDAKTPEPSFQSVEVSLHYLDKDKPLGSPLLEKWRSWLTSGRQVRIMFLRPKVGSRLTRIESLDQFLTAWLRDGQEPVAIRTFAGQDQGAEAAIKLDARAANRIAQKLADQASSENQSWLLGLRDLSVLAETGMASSQDIAAALGGANEKIWQAYYREKFEQAFEMEAALQALLDKMKRLGL